MSDAAHREITYWRHLLTQVAQDLERTAQVETDAKRKTSLEARAMRIRQRLHPRVGRLRRDAGSPADELTALIGSAPVIEAAIRAQGRRHELLDLHASSSDLAMFGTSICTGTSRRRRSKRTVTSE